jgi:electron transport protein HydN
MNTSADILSLLEKLMNRFIIADANKCIGCRTCEVACVVSHQDNQDCASLTPETFLPRIHVIKGVNVSATLCRQCEDAPCANVCRTVRSAVIKALFT